MNNAQTGKVWNQWTRLAESAPARFKRYGDLDRTKLTDDTAGDVALVALATVAWNTALAESLTPVLQAVEISLRNWLDRAVVAYKRQLKQPNADTWLLHPPHWVHPKDRELIDAARTKLEDHVRQGKRVRFSHDDMVATTSFALWSNMVRSNTVWSALAMYKQGQITKSFSDRHALHKLLDDVRNLRNRAYHLEPIFVQPDIADIHDQALKLLQILDPRLGEIVRCIDRFPSVFNSGTGWQAYRDLLFDHYGLGALGEP